MYFDRFHSPALSAALALAVLRATASSSATACSAAETMLEVGALTTMTPARRGGRHLDVVQPDAGARDDLQPRRGGDRLGVDLGGAAHDHRVGLGERGEQGRPVGAVDVADVEVVGEHLDGGGGEFFGDEYDGIHAVLVDVVLGRAGATGRRDAPCADPGHGRQVPVTHLSKDRRGPPRPACPGLWGEGPHTALSHACHPPFIRPERAVPPGSSPTRRRSPHPAR